MLRHAHIHDIPAVSRIINDAAEYGLMLHRSLAYLYEHVRDFHVAVAGDGEGEQVIGVCGLNIVWSNLAEIYALAVQTEHRGKGIGKQLVQTCLDEAKTLGIARVMTLTYEKVFFEKLGFAILDRQQLPLKVWSECVRCAKNQACDEIAIVYVLADVPEPQAPQPVVPSEYVVPTTVKGGLPRQQKQKMDEAH